MFKKLFFGALWLAFAQSASATYSYQGCGGSGGNPNPLPGTCNSYSWDFKTLTPPSVPDGVSLEAKGLHQDTVANDTFTVRPLTIYSPDHLALNYNDYNNGGTGSEGTPYHAFDNNSGYDMVIFKFDKPVTLSQISMGYVDTDSDFSLFAFNPVTPGSMPVTGAPAGIDAALNADIALSLGNMLDSGWELIGSFDYDAKATGGTTNHVDGVLNLEAVTATAPEPGTGPAKNILNYSSSYWAISAVYDTIADTGAKYGNVAEDTFSTSKTGNDRFKIASIAGCYSIPNNPPGVPEPASLALMLVGMAGMSKTLRRRAQR